MVWRDQARKMRRFEAETLRRFDTVIAVSVRDADALQKAYGLAHVEPVETGVDVEYYAFHGPADASGFGPDGGTVVFTGSMDSRSNIEGVGFLMDEVWPLVLRRRPRGRPSSLAGTRRKPWWPKPAVVDWLGSSPGSSTTYGPSSRGHTSMPYRCGSAVAPE